MAWAFARGQAFEPCLTGKVTGDSWAPSPRQEMFAQKRGYGPSSCFVEELLAAVAGAMNDLQSHGEAHRLISAEEFQGLIDRHLGVLVAVKQEQGRIRLVDVKNRTSDPCQILTLRG